MDRSRFDCWRFCDRQHRQKFPRLLPSSKNTETVPSFQVSAACFSCRPPVKFITIKPAAMEATITSFKVIHFPCNQLQGFSFLAYSVFRMSETGRSPPPFVGPQDYPAEVCKDAVSLSPISKLVILLSKWCKTRYASNEFHPVLSVSIPSVPFIVQFSQLKLVQPLVYWLP
jgi:hypothetical protein